MRRPRRLGASPSAPASGSAPDGVAAQLRWVDGEPLVLLAGELDTLTAADVAAAGALLRRWSARAVVDASRVDFVDVSGLRALLSLAGPGEDVLVLRPSRAVVRLLGVLAGAGAGLAVASEPGRRDALRVVTPPEPW